MVCEWRGRVSIEVSTGRAVNKQLASHGGEMEAQRRAMSIEMLDSVQTIIGEGCGKPSWSRAALGKGKAAK